MSHSQVSINLNQHFRDAIQAEADALGLTVSAFIRAMIRGYFAAALHGR